MGVKYRHANSFTIHWTEFLFGGKIKGNMVFVYQGERGAYYGKRKKGCEK